MAVERRSNKGFSRVLLSLGIVIFLFFGLLSPIRDLALSRPVKNALVTVFEPLGLMGAWGYYAPNPEIPQFIEFEISDKDDQLIFAGQWPAMRKKPFLSEVLLRRAALTTYVLQSDEKLKRTIADYLCRTTCGASSISFWRKVGRISPLQEFRNSPRSSKKLVMEKKYGFRHLCQDGALASRCMKVQGEEARPDDS